MIAAEYERLVDLTGLSPSAIDAHKWDKTVFDLMDQLGFFNLLKIRRSPHVALISPTTVALRFRSGKLAHGTESGKLIDGLEDLASKLLPNSEVNFERLAGAVLEGIINTKQHAYPKDLGRKFRCTPRWWATGAIDVKSRKVSAIIYDQGASIPATLITSSLIIDIKSAFRRLTSRHQLSDDDGAVIQSAMEVSYQRDGANKRAHPLTSSLANSRTRGSS